MTHAVEITVVSVCGAISVLCVIDLAVCADCVCRRRLVWWSRTSLLKLRRQPIVSLLSTLSSLGAGECSYVVYTGGHITFHKVGYKHPSGWVGNSIAALLNIYFSICYIPNISVPKTLSKYKIQCGLTKLFQKWKDAIFLPHSVDGLMIVGSS